MLHNLCAENFLGNNCEAPGLFGSFTHKNGLRLDPCVVQRTAN
jgi:hypothetical protein